MTVARASATCGLFTWLEHHGIAWALASGAEGVRRLSPEEERIAATIPAPNRRRDFRAGRLAAHRALERIGHRRASVTRGPTGAPRFPDGIVGSIAHAGDRAFAAAAPAGRLHTLGVDIEPADAAAARDIAAQFPAAEIARLERLGLSRPEAILACFGLREALYKAEADALGRWIDHTEVEFHAAGADLLRPMARTPDLARRLEAAEAAVAADDGYVLAALWTPIASSSG